MVNKPLTNEDFDLESGFPDDFDGAITDVIFGPNPSPQYRAKSSEPGLTIITESPELEEPNTAWYSLGAKKGWQVTDKGASIVSSVNPDAKSFNINSRAGNLIARVITLVGEGDVAKGKEFFAKRGFYMTQAGMLLGLNFHWKVEVLATQEGGKSNSLLPTAYFGEVPVAAAPAVKGVKSAATTVDTTALDDIVVKNASGKSEPQVKVAMMKTDEYKNRATTPGMVEYFTSLISGPKLAELEAAGKIAKGADGKYV